MLEVMATRAAANKNKPARERHLSEPAATTPNNRLQQRRVSGGGRTPSGGSGGQPKTKVPRQLKATAEDHLTMENVITTTAGDLEAAVEAMLTRVLVKPQIAETLCNSLMTKMMGEIEKKLDVVKLSVVTLEEKIEAGKQETGRLNADIGKLRRELIPAQNMQKAVSTIEAQLCEQKDEMEQVQRTNNLMFFGIPEKKGESLVTLITNLAKDIDVTLKMGDILHCRRTGRQDTNKSGKPEDTGKPGEPEKPGKPRPIVCKFASYAVRSAVYHSKKKLKGGPFTIREDLSPGRLVLLNHAVQRFGLKKVWTSDGAVLVSHGGKTLRLTTMEQLSGIK